ncbi:MAG: hypothetical protein HQ525_02250 [Anaerolineae bacterium]|nr:hypothetical protein [Anaerolineae bacterium]
MRKAVTNSQISLEIRSPPRYTGVAPRQGDQLWKTIQNKAFVLNGSVLVGLGSYRE